DVARAFNDIGTTAFVLKYRTPSERHMLDKTRGPLQDAQQAIHVVRDRADEWRIDRSRIGVVGFSAGGHLGATAATQFDQPVLPEWRSANLRPDFLILIYPVISFGDELAHRTSREQLLGSAPAPDLIKRYSNELHVAVELIVYPSGGHGFGLNNPATRDRWIDRCAQWLERQAWTSGQREAE